MFDFQIKVAQTQEEIAAAQRLRFEVFHTETKERSQGEQHDNLDIDEYDKISKHLIIIDKSKNLVIGTYRLLLGSDVGKIGFHAEKIFDINNIKNLDGGLLELGRSCIHRGYRNNSVINLLWNAIAWQVRAHSIKYIFGCPRLGSTDPKDVSEAFRFIKNKYYAPQELWVNTLPENVFRQLTEDIEINNPRIAFRKLSPLIKGYLHIGALVCSYPAVYHEFNSVVLFMLLPTDKIVNPYRRHFFGDNDK